MGDVTTDVTQVMQAVGDVAKGLAAKNQTMKDGPPAGGGGGGGAGSEQKPAAGSTTERQQAYDKYKDAVSEIWDRHAAAGFPDNVAMGLELGQAVVDLGVSWGPGVFDALLDVAKLGKK